MMGIQNNAGKILKIIYHRYLEDEIIEPKVLVKELELPGRDIDKAIKYLKDLGLIDIAHTMGNYEGVQNFVFKTLTPSGINVIEDDEKFKEVFNLE